MNIFLRGTLGLIAGECEKHEDDQPEEKGEGTKLFAPGRKNAMKQGRPRIKWRKRGEKKAGEKRLENNQVRSIRFQVKKITFSWVTERIQ